jgi:hypothetical protein
MILAIVSLVMVLVVLVISLLRMLLMLHASGQRKLAEMQKGTGGTSIFTTVTIIPRQSAGMAAVGGWWVERPLPRTDL